AMEKVDQVRHTIGDAEQQVAKAKEELAKIQQTVRGQEESLRTDVHRLEEELKTAETALPADFRDAYYRVVKAHGQDAMAQVEGESCGGCNQQLTTNMTNDLLMSRVTFCKICGRLLYLPEDRTIGRK